LQKVFHPSLPYIVFGTLAVIESILMTVFMPETKNQPLPEKPPPRIGKKGPDDRESVENGVVVSGNYVIAGEEDTIRTGQGIEMGLMSNGSDFALRRPDRNA
jgi:hypothetical protein